MDDTNWTGPVWSSSTGIDLTVVGTYTLTATFHNTAPTGNPPGWAADPDVSVDFAITVDGPGPCGVDENGQSDLSCCGNLPDQHGYCKATNVCCNNTLGCPAPPLVTPEGAICGTSPPIGGDFKYCFVCPDGNPFAGWSVECVTDGRSGRVCSTGSIGQTNTPFPLEDGCWIDRRVNNVPLANQPPCEDVFGQVVYVGMDQLNVYACSYNNQIVLDVNPSGPYPICCTVRTTSFGVSQECTIVYPH